MRDTSLLCGLALGAVGSIACATQASTVRVTKDAVSVNGCVHLGSIEGSDVKNRGMREQGVAENNATSRMRENAVKLGANTVLVTRGLADNSGSTQLGEAYNCPGLPASR